MSSNRILTPKQLEAILHNLTMSMTRELEPTMKDVADDVKKEAKDLIDPSKPTIYPKHPYDTGSMYNAIESEVHKDSKSIEGWVVVNQPNHPKSKNYYPIYPYEGWSTSEKYGPRMFLRDAANRRMDKTVNRLAKAVQKTLQEASS